MARFERVAIIGCGLLGASLGLALKQRGLAGTVVGIGRNASTLEKARAAGAIDDFSTDLAAAADAAMIVVATPVLQAAEILEKLAAGWSEGTILTDVGSTKARICERAESLWPAERPFVGAHPMAGSEKSGPDAARPDLYEGAVCIVEDSPNVSLEAREAVDDLWRLVGSRLIYMDPVQHDKVLACTSHLPHVAAACVAAHAGGIGDVRELIGNGFRDVTRIAASRPEVWTEICLSNKEAMLAGLRAYEHWLGDFRHALEDEDAVALERFFAEGKAAREGLVGS